MPRDILGSLCNPLAVGAIHHWQDTPHVTCDADRVIKFESIFNQ